jgi:dTDP-4-dehydrorhamnose reductase
MSSILVTGGDGLVAHALKELNAADHDLILLGHRDFDLTNSAQMRQQLDAINPQVVINTAAYNLVEQCEKEREISWNVNATGPGTLAQLCAEKNLRLVHYSTDYVFDGAKNAPYLEADPPHPLNHYGAGKLASESNVLAASSRHLVLRTSWVFGAHPTQTKSYVHSILRAAQSGRDLKATSDQISVPTFAGDLARWTLEMIQKNGSGLFHAVNDEGVSRFDWTEVILAEASRTGLIAQLPKVESVTSDFFKSTMPRPKDSRLDNGKLAKFLGHSLGSWRGGLRKMLAQEARPRLV